MKPSSLDKLFARTNCRNLLPNDREQFFKAGKLAYDYLMDKLDSTQITDYQVINAMGILVTMRYIGDPSETIGKILVLTQDSRIKVRSVAVTIAIALLLQSEHCGTPAYQLNRQELTNLIDRALLIGLDTSRTSLALDFINGKF